MPPIRREKRTMSEQTRIDGQLDQLAAERTSELAAANDALRKELAAERQRAEAAQRINEGGAQLILASIPGLVASLTPTGDVDFVNDPLIEYCARTLEELQHWGTGDTVHPDDLPRVLQTFTQGIASGEPYDFEARLRRFDGAYRWFQVRGLPLRDVGGGVLPWGHPPTHIDEPRPAAAALREHRAR